MQILKDSNFLVSKELTMRGITLNVELMDITGEEFFCDV